MPEPLSKGPVAATDEAFHLAEGPVWDDQRQRLLWVDIEAGELLEGALEHTTITISRRRKFEGTLGAVAVASDGAMVVAARDRLLAVAEDGRIREGPQIVPRGSARRCNDGAVDPAGRFLVGTLSLGAPSRHEALVRLEEDCSLTVIDDDLTLSNGIAWSADGGEMFNVDTMRRLVYRRSYDVATGETGPRHVHLRLTEGFPDGIAMDAEDHLWVAVWGAGEVRRFAPDGIVDKRLHVPAPHVSSVAFVGDQLDTLVICTATQELSADQRRAFPDSGRLFLAAPGARGVPLASWTRVDF
jgi:sugar lactone lactonase YvrE